MILARRSDPGARSQAHKQAMDRLLALFSWPVEEEYMHSDFEVRTDPVRKVHVVHWPRESARKEPAFERYLHEMGHALLAEKVHPQFSRPVFTRNTDPSLRMTYQALFDAALDWYVQALIMEIAPDQQGADLDARFRQTAQMLRQGAALPSVEFVMDAGMALASFQHFRGLEMETQGKLADVVQAFLRTPPDKPTLFGLQSLVRGLLAVFGTHTATLVSEKGFERWRIDAVKKD